MRDEVKKVRRPRRRQKMSGYLLTWTALAACALGYLGVAAAYPSLLATLLPMPGPGAGANLARSGSYGSDLNEQVATIGHIVKGLRQQVAETRETLDSQAAQSAEFERRLAATEVQLLSTAAANTGSVAGSPPVSSLARFAAPARAAPPVATGKATTGTHDAGGRDPGGRLARVNNPRTTNPGFEETISAAIQPAPTQTARPRAQPVRVLNSGNTNSGNTSTIATGSLPQRTTAPPAFPPPTVSRGDGPRQAIEIGRAESLDGLRTKWGELAVRNGAVLKRLAPRYRITSDGNGGPFKLLAGPFTNAAEATRACAAMRAKRVACRVGDYTGNAL